MSEGWKQQSQFEPLTGVFSFFRIDPRLFGGGIPDRPDAFIAAIDKEIRRSRAFSMIYMDGLITCGCPLPAFRGMMRAAWGENLAECMEQARAVRGEVGV